MKYIVILIFACISCVVYAQPSRVIIHSDGRIELVAQAADNPNATSGESESVPVFTEQPDGSLAAGVMYLGMSESGYHSMKYPGGVIRHEDGRYEVEIYTWSVMHGPKGRLWEHQIPGSEMAEVYDAVPTPQPNPQRGGSTLITVYNHNGAPDNLQDSESLVRRSIEITVERYRNLLKDDAILATFEFSWDILGMDTIAQAECMQSAQSYSLIRNGILNTFAANPDDSDFFENGLYNNFPLGSSIAYARPGNANDSTNAIRITWPLRTKLIGAGNNANLQIAMNADMPGLDVDPSDGIAGIDLTGVLVHEIGHHLGFLSNVECLDLIFEDSITVWDIFRMNAGLGAVSPSEFAGQRRELRDTEEANAALQLNSSQWIIPLSRGNTPGGDERQSSHWKDDFILGSFMGSGDYFFPNPYYVGIMDPTVPVENVNGQYLQDTDIRAFDVMGYGIDAGDFMPVQVPVINSPDGVEVNPALPLELDWTPQPGSISSDILIYDLGTTIAAIEPNGPTQTLVFRQNDVAGGQLTIPLSELTLLPGHQYQWHAAVFNPMGLHLTEPATFTAACIADRTGDGVVNFFDMGDFLTDFKAMDPSADLNGDGNWDFFDVNLFTTAFIAGCP